ncbi:MAG TPA: hypothetical protein VHP99_14175 [Pyrinomonadaceae bacterium]|nr:hypothetical protein [Pyrinomonadaceae bacterium]
MSDKTESKTVISLKTRLIAVSAAIVALAACCYSVLGQQKLQLFSKIEAGFGKQEPEWKIAKIFEGEPGIPSEDISLRRGKQQALVSVKVWHTSQEAHEIFAGQVIAFDNVRGKRGERSKLPDLGDENYIWTNRATGVWPTLYFRKGNVFVWVFAPTVIVAKRFARHVLDQIENQQ